MATRYTDEFRRDAVRDQACRSSSDTFHLRTGYGALTRRGLVQETGLVQSLVCDECSEAHDAEVIFEGGQYGFFCPEIGFVSVERTKLLGAKPELQTLVACIGEAFDCKRRKKSPIHGLTWRVGVLETVAGGLTIYFHPRLEGREDVLELKAALQREVKSPFRLILTAVGSLAVSGTKSACLDEVLELDPVSGDVVECSDLRAIVESPLENSGGRPNVYGAKLDTIIQSRLGNGQALLGRNEEGKAILDVYRRKFPYEKPPSLPTIMRYLTKARGGS